MPWDPDLYHRFQRERFAPFEDLQALIVSRRGLRVADLGSGTGELTRRLADWLPGSDVLGIDTSPQMLERAQSQVRPGLRFEQADLRRIEGRWDLIFSHAALQWVPEHETLIPHLLSHLTAGGQLAVQMPANHGHPSHLLLIETAQEEPFRSALQGWLRHSPVLPAERYAELLYQQGASDIVALEKVYPHVLPDADAVGDWMAGTALVPYLERLPTELHDRFMARFRQRLRAQWPERPVFYGFRRLHLAAKRTRSPSVRAG